MEKFKIITADGAYVVATSGKGTHIARFKTLEAAQSFLTTMELDAEKSERWANTVKHPAQKK